MFNLLIISPQDDVRRRIAGLLSESAGKVSFKPDAAEAAPLVQRGPYRFFRHPNYVAVVIELVAASMLFGAWRTAIGISALNAIALRIRIRAEDQALRA